LSRQTGTRRRIGYLAQRVASVVSGRAKIPGPAYLERRRDRCGSASWLIWAAALTPTANLPAEAGIESSVYGAPSETYCINEPSTARPLSNGHDPSGLLVRPGTGTASLRKVVPRTNSNGSPGRLRRESSKLFGETSAWPALAAFAYPPFEAPPSGWQALGAGDTYDYNAFDQMRSWCAFARRANLLTRPAASSGATGLQARAGNGRVERLRA